MTDRIYYRQMLTVADAARYKGIHRQSMWRAVREGRVPATKDASGRLLIKKADLDQYQVIGHRPKSEVQSGS